MKFWKLIKKMNLDTHIRVYKCGLKYDGKAGDLRCANLFGRYGIENEVYHLLSTSDGVLEIMLKDNGHNWDCGKS